MRYVLLIIVLTSIVFTGCAKKSGGFAPSDRTPDSPASAPVDEITLGESFMKIGTSAEEGGWKMSFSNAELVQPQSIGSGWEVEIVHD